MNDYPNNLEQMAVGQRFRMFNYEGVYQRVRLPEAYQVGPGRSRLTTKNLADAIEVTPDGDGFHMPVCGEDSRVFLMARTKPVRRVESRE